MHGMPPAVIDNLGSYKPNGYNGSCVIGEGGIAPTVRENHGEVTAVMHPKYRIRKLTPRECFRLMDVDDADIDKIQGAGICNSQQYKLAGNSIVVNVLYGKIFYMEVINNISGMPIHILEHVLTLTKVEQ